MTPRGVTLVGGPMDGTKMTTSVVRMEFAGEVGPDWDGTQPLPVAVYDMTQPDTFTYSGTYLA